MGNRLLLFFLAEAFSIFEDYFTVIECPEARGEDSARTRSGKYAQPLRS